MALLTRKIRRQINSIKNTQKITKAMELVSTAKMRKAVNAVLACRPYANLAWQMVTSLSAVTNRELHPLLQLRQPVEKIGLVLISANRGLCGAFNQQIVREAFQFVASQRADANGSCMEFITIGRKGARTIAKVGQVIRADFPKPDIVTDIGQIASIAKVIIQSYLEAQFEKVVLIYTRFVNSLTQRPEVRQLLPLTGEADFGLGQISDRTKGFRHQEGIKEYLFEPSADYVLAHFLPRLVEFQIYQAILESNASEHSARMVAMKNASEAASELIHDLTLSFNKARQAKITQEINEISVAKAALEG